MRGNRLNRTQRGARRGVLSTTLSIPKGTNNNNNPDPVAPKEARGKNPREKTIGRKSLLALMSRNRGCLERVERKGSQIAFFEIPRKDRFRTPTRIWGRGKRLIR